MRRFIAIVLLALLPFQFSRAAVASYCEHLTQETGHFGHHDHRHHADLDGTPEPIVDLAANPDVAGEAASGAVGADCGHGHGHFGVLIPPQAGLPDGPSTARPGAAASETFGVHAPARPERPQWRPIA